MTTTSINNAISDKSILSRGANNLPLLYRSTTFDPFANLAMERLLMDALAPDEQLLLLWQNAHTVVIGRNQNPWKEARIAELEENGGTLARRLSGGGAVYHDIDNLNFSFISPKDSYSVEKNCRIVCEAVRSFGLNAVLTGRNDIEIEGAKFSGNAFFQSGDVCCHHGTLMIDVNLAELGRYLQPDPRKLSVRSISSVKSRVVNLRTLDERISVSSLSNALVEAYSKAYEKPAEAIPSKRLPAASDIASETAFFASSEWRLGKTFAPTHVNSERYGWGGIDIQLKVDEGVIVDVMIYSDALDTALISLLLSSLKGCVYHQDELVKLKDCLTADNPKFHDMLSDCFSCIGAMSEKG